MVSKNINSVLEKQQTCEHLAWYLLDTTIINDETYFDCQCLSCRKIEERKTEYFNDKNVIIEKEKVRCKERYGAIVCLYLDYLANSEIGSDVVSKSKKFVKVMNRKYS